MQTAPLLLTVGAGEALAQLFSYALSAIVMLYSVARLVRCPAKSLSLGRLSKVAWGMASLCIVVQLGALTVPLGALLTLRHLRRVTRRRARKTSVAGNEVPFAMGAVPQGSEQ